MNLQQIIQQIKFDTLYFIGGFNSKTRTIPIIEKEIRCTRKEVRFLGDTPNTIIYFKVANQEGYFRECRKHSSIIDFLRDLIYDYSIYVLNDESIYNEMCVHFSNKRSVYKFFNMGDGTNPYSPINRFRYKGDPSIIGIFAPSEHLRNKLFDIVQFCWGPIAEYKFCWSQKLGSYHLFNSSKSIVTYKVALALGIPELIPKTYYAKLSLDGQERVGVVVEPSPGISPTKGLHLRVTGRFQRELLNLNMLDVITYQFDHRPGNYFVSVHNNEVLSLSAFDNDAPTTLLPSLTISKGTYIGCSPLFKKNHYNRGYIDGTLMNTILNLDLGTLKKNLKGYCSDIELAFMCLRIKKIKKILRKESSLGRVVSISDNMWSENTVINEIESNDFGLTYLQLYCKCFN